MQLLWKRFVMPRRSETWLVLTIAVLLFAFGLVAQEVSEGEPLAFDQNIMHALRNPANPSVFRDPCGAGLHHELSKRARRIIRHHLSDGGSPSRPNPPLTGDPHLFDGGSVISHLAHWYEPNLPRCSLSERCSRRLVHWCSLGHGMLGTDGVARK